MEYGTEIINISKIKDSFFIGDKVSGTSLDVLIQFKITHIINASGNQIMNLFESIGIKYYTLFWSESPTQNLFSPNDEIVDKILLFIRESYLKGEGLLIHSVKGKDRCCLVVIIYLMKKYYWSVNKCIDYLKSKKEDIEIEPYFIQQLISYEERLSKITNIKTINWNDVTFKDNDEKLLRNTYINGIPVKQLNDFGIDEINNNYNKEEDRKNLIKKKNIHISWAKDENLISFNYEKELLFQEEIKPITCHMNLMPLKSNIKKMRDSLSLTKSLTVNKNNNLSNSVNNFKKLKIRADVDIDKISSEYNSISPNIIKHLIENDSFYFLGLNKNYTHNNIHSLNNEKSNKKYNHRKRPLSYDNKNKKNIKNKNNNIKEGRDMNKEQINFKSFSLNKNENGYKKGNNNNSINDINFVNDQNKIKKLIENSRDNKLLISLNNQNKMNYLINNFTYLNNNYMNGNSQYKKIYNNYPNKNFVIDSNSNSLSLSIKRGKQENKNNKKQSKFYYFKYSF